ncbi:cell division protein ZapA [Azospirillum halopraeferens]|uniref:cell division protein ZapA n=1 Tax=Azospirillum halopraeferens TaxID=34010 RepID=UPI0004166699|nr:cell division protein ZapA [Azospirillum halopraeferens]
MKRVEIEVNGRAYLLACEPGQEDRLRELAAYVDRRLKELTGGGRSAAEAPMLVMTCLVLADELQDLLAGRAVAPSALLRPSEEAEMVEAVDGITRRIEEVAARLERA